MIDVPTLVLLEPNTVMHEVAKKRCAPASIRLVDNNQFQVCRARFAADEFDRCDAQMGQAMKPNEGFLHSWISSLKKFYVTAIKVRTPPWPSEEALCLVNLGI